MSQATDTISVIIPAYNAAKFLRAAIESVLAQTLLPQEILVIDDGSKDETAAIAASFGGIVRCISQENRGLSGARNRGVEESGGELIALLDADDIWLPRKLELQVKQLRRHPKALACFTRTKSVDGQGRVLKESTVPRYPDLVKALLLYSCVVGPPSSALMRRSTFDKVGLFDINFSQCHDWEMWLRITEAGSITYVDEALLLYLVHDSNMSRNIPLLERDTFAVLRKFFRLHPKGKYARLKQKTYSNHWMIVSGSYLAAGNKRDSLRCLLRGILAYPPNLMRAAGLPLRRLQRRLRPAVNSR